MNELHGSLRRSGGLDVKDRQLAPTYSAGRLRRGPERKASCLGRFLDCRIRLPDERVFVKRVEIYSSRSRETVFRPGAQGYRLSCYSLTESAAAGVAGQPVRRGNAKPGRKILWQHRVPIRITAMVLTAEKLFVAGSPDVVDPKDPHGAWEGRKGGILAAFAAADGRKLAECKLPAPPVWDGMAAANGRLYISTSGGDIICME